MQRLLPYLLLMFFLNCNGSDKSELDDFRTNRILEYRSEVSFHSANNDREISTIKVAVAEDDNSRSEGLMDVHDLPADAGMLFIFEDNQPRSFWMANTPLSLDIIFVNSDMEIVRIHRNTPPYSHEQIQSDQPAKYVVEVNAGYSLRHDITEGMLISFTDY